MLMKIDKLFLAALASLWLVQQSDAGAVQISQDNLADAMKGKNSFLKFVRYDDDWQRGSGLSVVTDVSLSYSCHLYHHLLVYYNISSLLVFSFSPPIF